MTHSVFKNTGLLKESTRHMPESRDTPKSLKKEY